MASKKDFNIGDLVWAKMKGFPFWPGEIANPPTGAKSKKAHHYVFFFGSKNFAWISDENIVFHSEEMLKSASTKKKSTLLKTAIEEICEKAPKLPVQEKKSPGVSTSSNERKVAKAQKIKSKTKIRKKIVQKKRALDESANVTSPPRKSSRQTDDFSELINNTPPNLNYDQVVVESLPEQCVASVSFTQEMAFTQEMTSTEEMTAIEVMASTRDMGWKEYLDLETSPPVNLSEPHPNIVAKNVRPIDKKIGFIGLGLMGQRIVKNLLITGHNIMVWNRTAKKCKDFARAGALVAQSPADLIDKCDVVFCCVADRDAVKKVFFGTSGILEGLEKSSGTKGYIEMTTLDPETSIRLSDSITQKGGKYLESPITGSCKTAEEGSLFLLTAGSYELMTTYRSVFYTLTETSYFLSSDVGNGSKMNLIISMVLGIFNAALAEAMSLVERLNLSEESFLEIIEHSPLNSRLFRETGRAILARYFATNSSLKYQQNNLNLALVFGSSCEQPLPVTAAANEMFKHARCLHYANHDVSAVFLGAKY